VLPGHRRQPQRPRLEAVMAAAHQRRSAEASSGATRKTRPDAAHRSEWAGSVTLEGIWLVNGRGRQAAAGMELSGHHGEHRALDPRYDLTIRAEDTS
jgi:hypothetical protein